MKLFHRSQTLRPWVPALRRTMNGTRLLHAGKLLCLVAGLASCRQSVPPKIEICIGDGFGGADCILADGTKFYRSPTALRNYWMTSEHDQANFASWCYQTTPEAVKPAMAKIKEATQ